MDVVQKIPKDVPKPFFLFAHILSPHPPYIYHSDCSIRDEFRFELDPSVSVFRDREEMYALYRERLTCATELMRQTVVTILEEDPEALIVIQGDHGLGKLEDNRYAPFEHGKARYGILNALRVPQPCSEFLYESISPVNTFRLVFACLNGTRPNFVPDRMFGNSSQHLNTTDVTEEILPPEQGSRTTVPE